MKLVWENNSMAVEAPKDLQSGWHRTPNTQRARDEKLYPILRMGAIEMQRQAHEHLEQEKDKKRQAVIDILNKMGS
tara:strand:- start:1420 stop:1647 length:228 start_codon:yes stop_codon:yes gene_type:complete